MTSTQPIRRPVAECRQIVVRHESGSGAPATMSLRGADLVLYAGEMVSVVGPSGSGKSTLLHTLAGFTRPTAGRVILLGEDITEAKANRVAAVHRRGVGFVFQSYNLVPSLPVIDNVLLPARFARRRCDRDRARRIFADLGLGHRVGHRASDLSGGEQQRVAVARVLYERPAVVLADEPTGALDSGTGEFVLASLRRLADEGAAVLLVTHDLDGASLADRAVLLRDGHVVGHIDRPRADVLWNATHEGARCA